MDLLKGAGCVVMHKIPDSRFAHTAQDVGCDAVCIVGYEGGGHPGMAGVGSIVQLPLTLERCSIPVVGAGGVCDGRSMYAALAMGLDGVMVGTRFLMAEETEIGPHLRQLVIDSKETDTVLTQKSIRNALRSLKTQGALNIIEFENTQHPSYRMPAPQYQRNRRLTQGRNHLRNRQPGFHISTYRIQKNQESLHSLIILNHRQPGWRLRR